MGRKYIPSKWDQERINLSFTSITMLTSFQRAKLINKQGDHFIYKIQPTTKHPEATGLHLFFPGELKIGNKGS